MRHREELVRGLLGRDVLIAYVFIGILYLLRNIDFRAFQIPGYLLIVAYDVIEVLVPPLAPFRSIGFPLFMYLLAVIGAGGARLLVASDEDGSNWRRGLGGVSVLFGFISISFGMAVGGPIVVASDNPTPLAITGLTGLAFLLVGLLLLARSS